VSLVVGLLPVERDAPIEKTLGVSHSALYKLFPDKQALLDEVSDRWLLHIEAELEKVVGRKSKAATKLRDWFLTLHQLKLKKAQAAALVINSYAVMVNSFNSSCHAKMH
jgi:AcrR family transcriptional regulator